MNRSAMPPGHHQRSAVELRIEDRIPFHLERFTNQCTDRVVVVDDQYCLFSARELVKKVAHRVSSPLG